MATRNVHAAPFRRVGYARRCERGSSASRRPSPMKFTPSTSSAIRMPGGSQNHGAAFRTARRAGLDDHVAEARLAAPGRRGRGSDSDASSRIALATPNVATTVSGPTRFGSRWRVDDRAVADAEDARRGDELRLAQREQLAADDPRHLRPAEQADDRDHRQQARADDRHEDDHEQQGGDAQDRVGDRASGPGRRRPRRSRPASPISVPIDHVDRDRPEADDQRRPRTEDDARQDVAAGRVGPEEMQRLLGGAGGLAVR